MRGIFTLNLGWSHSISKTALILISLVVMYRSPSSNNWDVTPTPSSAVFRRAIHNESNTSPSEPEFLVPGDLPVYGILNSSIAAALIHEVSPSAEDSIADVHKFWSMFAKKGWTRWSKLEDACTLEPGFWDGLLATKQCDRNWYQGGFHSDDDRNAKDYRPTYPTKTAHALLGYDGDLGIYNCNQIEKRKGKGACEGLGFINLGWEAGFNMLRLDVEMGWNMCRNLEWVVCALQGMLPGQGGKRKIRFATKTKLILERFLNRNLDCEDDEKCELGYMLEDVFFVEVSIISYLCKNREELFELELGEDFECVFDRDAFMRMAEAASKSPRLVVDIPMEPAALE